MKIPISRALIFIFLSVIVISGPPFLGLLYYQRLVISRVENELYEVRTLLHSNALPTAYLASLLSLPANLYQLNKEELERKLLASPLIKSAKVKKVLPDKLLLEYTVRKPIALLSDFENVAIDRKGFLFPCVPFFSKEHLPRFYLGDIEGTWNQPLNSDSFHTAMELFALIGDSLRALDLSNMSHPSFGKREIIATVDQGGHTLYLRVNKRSFAKELVEFQTIVENIKIEGDCLIDLRLPQIALLQEL